MVPALLHNGMNVDDIDTEAEYHGGMTSSIGYWPKGVG
jgi:hypothetical protein